MHEVKLIFPTCRFILNLCVDSALNDEDEPAMIAFHFRTKFKHHKDGNSAVVMTCKRGPNGWDDEAEIDNTWIDDDGKMIVRCVVCTCAGQMN